MIIFLYFSQLQSVYYANLRNQPFLLARAPRRLGRFTTRDVAYFFRNVPSGADRGEKRLFSQVVYARKSRLKN